MISRTTRTKGTVLTSEAHFRNLSKTIVTPYTVRFISLDPAGVATVRQITPTGTLYSAITTLDQEGLWSFRWDCSGDYATADEFEIFVPTSIL